MTTTDVPTDDDFERIADAIDATVTLALSAADALDRSTSSACDYDDCLTNLSGDDVLGMEYRRLRSKAGFDKLERVLQVYSAWVNRLFAGNVELEGDAVMSADDLRTEIIDGPFNKHVDELEAKRLDALEAQVRACHAQLDDNARTIERLHATVRVVRDLLADGD